MPWRTCSPTAPASSPEQCCLSTADGLLAARTPKKPESTRCLAVTAVSADQHWGWRPIDGAEHSGRLLAVIDLVDETLKLWAFVRVPLPEVHPVVGGVDEDLDVQGVAVVTGPHLIRVAVVVVVRNEVDAPRGRRVGAPRPPQPR